MAPAFVHEPANYPERVPPLSSESHIKASRTLTQPRGIPRLTDPDLIYPGERLFVPSLKAKTIHKPTRQPPPGRSPAAPPHAGPAPTTAPSTPPPTTQPPPSAEPGVPAPAPTREPPAAPSTAPSPSSSTPHGQPPGSPSPAPTTSPSQQAGPGIGPGQPAPDNVPPGGPQGPGGGSPHGADSDDGISARSIAGYSALVAAGLITLLALKRLVQQRRRRPGRRIRLPETMSEAEQQMRGRQEPASAQLLDTAVRSLSAQLAGAAACDVPAPYPALVTLGFDQAFAQVLIDLETIGALTLTGSHQHICEVLAALALEMATSPWADHLIVVCVGFGADLPRVLGTGRARSADTVDEALTDFEARAREVQAVLDESPAESVRHARTAQVADDTWTPQILLSAEPFTTTEVARLAALVTGPHAGNLAAVVAASGQDNPLPGPWVLDATPDRVLAAGPLATELTLQRITYGQYQQVLADLATANDTEGVADPAWRNVPPEPVASAPPAAAPVAPVRPDSPAVPTAPPEQHPDQHAHPPAGDRRLVAADSRSDEDLLDQAVVSP